MHLPHGVRAHRCPGTAGIAARRETPMSGIKSDWRQMLSQPTYEVGEWQRDVCITARDGTRLYADVCVPKGRGPFPALMSMSAYGKDVQHLPIPVGLASDYSRGTGGIESGMSDYFVS